MTTPNGGAVPPAPGGGPAQGDASPRRSGGLGCLAQGCLTVLVLLAVLVVGAVGGWKRYGRDWARGRAEAFLAERPLLSAGLDFLDLDPLAPTSAPADPRARQSGVRDPAALPADLPRLPGAEAEAVHVGTAQQTVFQRLPGTPAEVEATLSAAFRGHGWAPGEPDRPGLWRKDDRACRVELAARTAGTELFLRCGGRGNAAR